MKRLVAGSLAVVSIMLATSASADPEPKNVGLGRVAIGLGIGVFAVIPVETGLLLYGSNDHPPQGHTWAIVTGGAMVAASPIVLITAYALAARADGKNMFARTSSGSRTAARAPAWELAPAASPKGGGLSLRGSF